jgi:hypothetical protein
MMANNYCDMSQAMSGLLQIDFCLGSWKSLLYVNFCLLLFHGLPPAKDKSRNVKIGIV